MERKEYSEEVVDVFEKALKRNRCNDRIAGEECN